MYRLSYRHKNLQKYVAAFMKMFKQQKLWIFTDQWTYKYVQQNEAHASYGLKTCIETSSAFFCVHVRFENSKPNQNAMVKNLRKFSTQWYTSYRYGTLEQIEDIHSPNHKLPIWINQADLPIPSIYLYSFLWTFFFSSIFWMRSFWLSERIAQCTGTRLCGIEFLMEFSRITNSIH